MARLALVTVTVTSSDVPAASDPDVGDTLSQVWSPVALQSSVPVPVFVTVTV